MYPLVLFLIPSIVLQGSCRNSKSGPPIWSWGGDLGPVSRQGTQPQCPTSAPMRTCYPDSPSTALSQDRLWNLFWWEEQGGMGARPSPSPGFPTHGPAHLWGHASPLAYTPPPHHQPPDTSTLRPRGGYNALLPPFLKLSPSPHPGEEQGAEDGRVRSRGGCGRMRVPSRPWEGPKPQD